jgi:hypothetical protein
MICDNGSIHHARKVTAYLEKHPRLGTPARRLNQGMVRPGESGGRYVCELLVSLPVCSA